MKPPITPSQPTAIDRWHRLAAEMLHPCFELDAEAFALLLSTFLEARRDGHEFDPGTIAIMHVLDRQARDTDDDTDADAGVDDGQEEDDPHVGMAEDDDRESDECDDVGTHPQWGRSGLRERPAPDWMKPTTAEILSNDWPPEEVPFVIAHIDNGNVTFPGKGVA